MSPGAESRLKVLLWQRAAEAARLEAEAALPGLTELPGFAWLDHGESAAHEESVQRLEAGAQRVMQRWPSLVALSEALSSRAGTLPQSACLLLLGDFRGVGVARCSDAHAALALLAPRIPGMHDGFVLDLPLEPSRLAVHVESDSVPPAAETTLLGAAVRDLTIALSNAAPRLPPPPGPGE